MAAVKEARLGNVRKSRGEVRVPDDVVFAVLEMKPRETVLNSVWLDERKAELDAAEMLRLEGEKSQTWFSVVRCRLVELEGGAA
jgi:hypothetical protein